MEAWLHGKEIPMWQLHIFLNSTVWSVNEVQPATLPGNLPLCFFGENYLFIWSILLKFHCKLTQQVYVGFTAGFQLTLLKDHTVCGYASVLYKGCPFWCSTNFWFIPHCEFFLLPSLPRELGTAFCNCFHQSRIHSIWENPVRIKAPAFSPV